MGRKNSTNPKGDSNRDSKFKSSWAQPITTDQILHSSANEVLSKFGASESGLTTKEAEEILRTCGYNEIAIRKKRATIVEFLLHFKNPLVLILLTAGFIAGFFGEVIEPIIIFSIV